MKLRALLCVAIVLIPISGCGKSTQAAIEITAGDVTTLRISSSETPVFQRVVALANGSAEVIDSLGLKKILIGRDIASTDSSLQSVPIVTSGHQVVAEKIISLSPDLVIIDPSVGPSQAIDSLKKSGISVISIKERWDVAGISKKIIEIAAILKVQKSGQALSAKIAKSISRSAEKVTGSPRVAFLYLRGGNSIYLLGGKGSGADSIVQAIGAIDVGAEKSSIAFSNLTSESLVGANPEVILVMIKGLASVGGAQGLVNLPGIAQTDAGKRARIIAVDDSLLLSFGPRTPDLLNKLAAALNEVRK
ncbi:ChuT ABC-type hemin transport system, periplasmic component [Candidatus Nanopelagicaceae bacterium]